MPLTLNELNWKWKSRLDFVLTVGRHRITNEKNCLLLRRLLFQPLKKFTQFCFDVYHQTSLKIFPSRWTFYVSLGGPLLAFFSRGFNHLSLTLFPTLQKLPLFNSFTLNGFLINLFIFREMTKKEKKEKNELSIELMNWIKFVIISMWRFSHDSMDYHFITFYTPTLSSWMHHHHQIETTWNMKHLKDISIISHRNEWRRRMKENNPKISHSDLDIVKLIFEKDFSLSVSHYSSSSVSIFFPFKWEVIYLSLIISIRCHSSERAGKFLYISKKISSSRNRLLTK